jgi:hypothetical protein
MSAIFLPSSLEILPLAELSDENKTKVCLIQDISKAEKLAGIKPMNGTRFDYYYDLDAEELGSILSGIQRYARYQRDTESPD